MWQAISTRLENFFLPEYADVIFHCANAQIHAPGLSLLLTRGRQRGDLRLRFCQFFVLDEKGFFWSLSAKSWRVSNAYLLPAANAANYATSSSAAEGLAT